MRNTKTGSQLRNFFGQATIQSLGKDEYLLLEPVPISFFAEYFTEFADK